MIRVPAQPEIWQGSKPEWAIFYTLSKMGINFNYQESFLGGRQQMGGLIVDFMIPDYNLAINVQSTYYHYIGVEMRAHDAMVRASVESRGIRLIYIDEEDALRNPEYYIQQAIAGIDHSKMKTA